MRLVSFVLGFQILVSAVVFAGAPWIDNAALDSTPLNGSLDAAVAAWTESTGEPSWMGWHAPMVEKGGILCCWSGSDRGMRDQVCTLDSSHRHLVFSSDRRTGLSRDNGHLVVLLKTARGQLVEMRLYSDGCRLDAGGAGVTWLESVDVAESVALLARWAGGETAVKDEALMALALHATPIATQKLVGLARQSPDADLRGEALFWLSHTGAAEASEVILQALAEDPDSEVRDEAVFALSQLPEKEGLPLLLEILRDRSRPAAIREEAFFWYVQSGDDQALDLIAEILSN